MNATPEDLSQQAEREELARLLPAAAARGLSPHRHLLRKEHLMNAVLDDTRAAAAPARRRRLALRVALPVGLAAAAAGVALTGLPGSTAGPDGPAPQIASPQTSAAGASPGPGPTDSLGTVTNAAYELRSAGDGLVTLTILDATGPVDAPGLQRDLDRLGVRSRVYAGEPGCRAPEPKEAPVPENAGGERLTTHGWTVETTGKRTVLSVRPHRIAADAQLYLYFPLAKSDPANGFRELEAGLMLAPAPACMPARTFTNPLASLFPTPPAG
ncbi:hypothetical protein ACFCX4_26160 [Kitasatospora sp. NPDC056327]|uniref:hypothetical protein n=1 Tax=Kitasatospora sp. NPDC056327 TaxID=3345785 RepID=UPI0035E2BD2E